MIQSDIMIVDDNPANLKLLEEMLIQRGHEVRSFPLGRLALAAAAASPPRLILLDINMPEMNGYEVCERLQATPALAGIPVIFLSALREIEDKVKAFQAGGVDFISKPFQFEEVQARVQTHLRIHDLQQALEQQNEGLEEIVAQRTLELATMNERLSILDSSKSAFLSLISHELRTPLNGILGIGELMMDMVNDADTQGLRDAYQTSRKRIISLLDDALLLTEIDARGSRIPQERLRIEDLIAEAIRKATPLATSRSVSFEAPLESDTFLTGNRTLFQRAFGALIETAVKFTVPKESVRVSAEPTWVLVEGRGKLIPAAALPTFFDLFAVSEASTPGGDLGLGPAVAWRILSLFGASVCVENRTPSGVLFTVAFSPSTS